MALTITPVGLTPVDQIIPPGTAEGEYYVEVTIDDDLDPGDFVVLALCNRASPGPVLSTFGDTAGNIYSYGWTATSSDQPLVYFATARLLRAVVGGATSFNVGGWGMGGLFRAWVLRGADSFISAATGIGSDPDPGATGDTTSWDANTGMATVTGEALGIGFVVAGLAGGVTVSESGDYTDEDTDSASRSAFLIYPAADYDSLSATLNTTLAGTAPDFSGSFSSAPNCWAARQEVFRPVWFQRARQESLTRGPEGSLARASVSGGILQITHQEGSGGSGQPAISGGLSRAAELHYDRAARLLLLRTEQAGSVTSPANAGTGGYTTKLFTSRDQARHWDAGQTLWSPSSPPSDGIGYGGIAAALDPHSGLLVALVWDHAAREWLATVGTLDSAGTAWTFTSPARREYSGIPTPLLGGAYARLIRLGDGRYRFCYVEEGAIEQWVTTGGGTTLQYWPLRDGDTLKFLELRDVAADGSLTWGAEETALVADAPYLDGGGRMTYPTFHAVDWLEDKRRGLHLFAFHRHDMGEREAVPSAPGGNWYMLPGTLGSDGVTWSWGTPVALTVSPTNQPAGAFDRRADGVWWWTYNVGSPMRTARALDSAGVGSWS